MHYFRCLAVCIVLLGFGACAHNRPQATVYACEPKDNDLSRLAIHPNGRFVVSLAYRGPDGARKSAGLFAGRYAEGLGYYDLNFESLIRPQIEDLFKGTVGGMFVGNGSTYRIQKRFGHIVIDGCKMDRLPS